MYGDSVAAMKILQDRSVHTMCSSIPFFLQRKYEGQSVFGMEKTRGAWADNQLLVFDEVHRVLRDDGTAFVVVGEAYAPSKRGDVNAQEPSLQAPFLAEKLRASGWCVKSLIVIEYTNRTPTSMKNRPAQTHEYGILLSKQKTGYYWDYITSRERGVKHDRLLRSVWTGTVEPAWRSKTIAFKHTSVYPRWVVRTFLNGAVSQDGVCSACGAPRLPKVNKAKGGSTGKSWLEHGDDLVHGNGKTSSSAGYVPATIVGWKAGCSCKAKTTRPLVLDPYTGTSTTGVVALELGCDYVGIDSDRRCIDLSRERLSEAASASSPFDAEAASRRQTEMFSGEAP